MSGGGNPALQAEVERQHALIMRGTAFGDAETRVTMERELRERLAVSIREEQPLRVYLGVDPTAPDLHLGHVVGLRKLRTFAELGHQAILLIGDFTGLVGDPSDKDALRPMSTMEQLQENARGYQEQAFKVLDPERTEVRRNSEWLGGLDFASVIRLASHFTVAQFMERDTFARRLDRGAPVYVHEFMYGLMQGYDAVALRADVQIGGTDQTFNLIAGRILQRAHGQPPQVAITFPILVGLDGKARMSKSQGNHIGIDEPPDEQYGKTMSIPDAALPQFFTLGTNLPADEVAALERDLATGDLHPMEAKRRLARAVVREWHGAAAASAARRAVQARLLQAGSAGGDAGGGASLRRRHCRSGPRRPSHNCRRRQEQGRGEASCRTRRRPTRRPAIRGAPGAPLAWRYPQDRQAPLAARRCALKSGLVTSSRAAISRHYTTGDLSERMLASLRESGKPIDGLRPEELEPFDQFHLRGRYGHSRARGVGGGRRRHAGAGYRQWHWRARSRSSLTPSAAASRGLTSSRSSAALRRC